MSVSSSVIDQAVRVEHANTLYRLMPRTLMVYPLGGLLLVATLWQVESHPQLVLWLAALVLVVVLRSVSIRRFARHPPAAERVTAWCHLATLFTFITGAILGAAAVAFVDPAEPLSVLVVGGIIMGATSGAIASLYPYPPSYWGFVLPSMGTLIVVLLVHAEPATLIVAVVCVLMQGTNILTSLTLYRAVDRSLRVSHENEALLRQAQTANAAKTRFLAAASHDLRQPLHALGLFFAMLSDELSTPRAKVLMGHVESALASVGGMLMSILDISKLDAGIVSPVWGSVNVQALFDRLEREFTPLAQENGNRLRVRSSVLFVRSDANMLERMLRNLIANAVKYTHHGRVLVAARKVGDELRFEVHDTGCGIAPALQRAVFEEFYQVDNPQREQSQGMGLGLAIVERHAALLGHPLSLVSATDRGSCFAICAPLLRPPAVTASGDEEAGLRTRFDGVVVVLVDDDAVVLTAMSALLEQWGCRVIAADSGDSAVALIEQSAQQPDLIVTDYRLRDEVTGNDVIALVQGHLGHPLPAAIVTGDTAPERLREANQAGHPLLHKPVKPQRLMATVRELLAASAAARVQ